MHQGKASAHTKHVPLIWHLLPEQVQGMNSLQSHTEASVTSLSRIAVLCPTHVLAQEESGGKKCVQMRRRKEDDYKNNENTPKKPINMNISAHTHIVQALSEVSSKRAATSLRAKSPSTFTIHTRRWPWRWACAVGHT